MQVFSEETREPIYKITRKCTGIKCDICNKIIPVENNRYRHYFEVTTGHHDWGNDSYESRTQYDICPDCINGFVTDYLKDAYDTTRYLEVETEYVTPGEKVIKYGESE